MSLATKTCCVRETYKRVLTLMTIFSIKCARDSFSLLTTEDKISVAGEKNRALCVRLYLQTFFPTLHLSPLLSILDWRVVSYILRRLLFLYQKRDYNEYPLSEQSFFNKYIHDLLQVSHGDESQKTSKQHNI